MRELDNTPYYLKLNALHEEGRNLVEPSATAGSTYWQIRAYGNFKYQHPILDTATYGRHDGQLREWYAMYAGKVSSKGYMSTHGSGKHTLAAHTDVNRLVTLPKYEIFCDFNSKDGYELKPVR